MELVFFIEREHLLAQFAQLGVNFAHRIKVGIVGLLGEIKLVQGCSGVVHQCVHVARGGIAQGFLAERFIAARQIHVVVGVVFAERSLFADIFDDGGVVSGLVEKFSIVCGSKA